MQALIYGPQASNEVHLTCMMLDLTRDEISTSYCSHKDNIWPKNVAMLQRNYHLTKFLNSILSQEATHCHLQVGR